MTPAFRFDQLYVISDLHFGGEPGFQIFGSQGEMTWFLRTLADGPVGTQIGLVINGDFVDFLAEAPPVHFDPHGAVRKLDRVATEDPTFTPIFAAMKYFLTKPHRTLIVNLGNHDLELALPWVRRRLVEILTGGSAEAQARLHLVFDGTGVLADVGGRSVLCVHGNEVDRWNPADFDKIREIGRDIQLGRPVKHWVPNAGTRMVIDVMNSVKRSYPFVDLLKPEKEGVVPTLVACDPNQLGNLDRIRGLVGAGVNRIWAGVSKPRGMLGAEPDGEQGEGSPARGQSMEGLLAATFTRQNTALRADAMMRAVEQEVKRGTDPMELVQGPEGAQLGSGAAILKWITDQPPNEVLREALEKLDEDRSFDPTDSDDTFRDLDTEVSPDIDFLVAGHTHLERALQRVNGGGYYFNSGTWARLMRIDPAKRSNPGKFKAVFDTLKDGTMSKLDASGLVTKRCTVVAIFRASADVVAGELRHVTTNARTSVTDFEVVKRFERTA